MSTIRVGRPEVSPAAPSHVPGVHEGNARRGARQRGGIVEVADGARATPRRSTGIDPRARRPILPSMPTLTPP